MTTTQPHNQTTTARPARVGGDAHDPFATIPGAYDDYTPPATKAPAPVPVEAIQPGTRLEAVPAGRRADGSPITRTIQITVDRAPWYSMNRTSVVLSDGKGVVAVVPASLRVLSDPQTPVAVVPAVQTPTPAAPVRVVTRTKVVDCPTYAWDNSDQAARDELGAFYSEYSALLDEAAHELIRAHLLAEWRKAGRLARLVDGREFTRVTDTPAEFVPDEQRWAVWQAAADKVSGEELVFAAGLTDEYRDFSDRDY